MGAHKGVASLGPKVWSLAQLMLTALNLRSSACAYQRVTCLFLLMTDTSPLPSYSQGAQCVFTALDSFQDAAYIPYHTLHCCRLSSALCPATSTGRSAGVHGSG